MPASTVLHGPIQTYLAHSMSVCMVIQSVVQLSVIKIQKKLPLLQHNIIVEIFHSKFAHNNLYQRLITLIVNLLVLLLYHNTIIPEANYKALADGAVVLLIV